MNVRNVVFACGAVLVLIGCAGRGLVTGPEPARYAEVARAVERDLSLQARERPLFEAGLAHALPHSAVYRPALARERFERLIELFPQSPRAQVAGYLLALLGEVDRLEHQHARERDETQRLHDELAAAHARLERLEDSHAGAEDRAERMRALAERLGAEVRQRDARIRELTEQLEALMKIDLQPPS